MLIYLDIGVNVNKCLCFLFSLFPVDAMLPILRFTGVDRAMMDFPNAPRNVDFMKNTTAVQQNLHQDNRFIFQPMRLVMKTINYKTRNGSSADYRNCWCCFHLSHRTLNCLLYMCFFKNIVVTKIAFLKYCSLFLLNSVCCFGQSHPCTHLSQTSISSISIKFFNTSGQ